MLAVENAIRPTAFGKKNWPFIGAPKAGSKAATFDTLPGSCLRRGLNPRDYLLCLFDHLPTATNQTAANLTPAAFAITSNKSLATFSRLSRSLPFRIVSLTPGLMVRVSGAQIVRH
ncbi:MAG: hypothetical protein V4675_02095 [Verrucomicrobiota bacterium]